MSHLGLPQQDQEVCGGGRLPAAATACAYACASLWRPVCVRPGTFQMGLDKFRETVGTVANRSELSWREVPFCTPPLAVAAR